ncbi:phage tail tube protein [Marinobacter salarius]|uniref:phage tail tube protein n=1 Tax=Marinobacter salarius TaxID=1420917 RepID=UPI003BAAEADE
MAVQNNKIRVAYRPAGSSDPWQVLRVTEDDLTTSTTTVESEEVRTDRMIDDSSTTSIDPEGSVSFEFTADTFDDMIEAAMHSTFTAGEVIIGTDQIKFDILKSDTQTDRHFLFENMSVSEANIEINEGALITGSFNFVGETVDLAYDPTGDTFNDTTETKVINCNKNIDNATLLFDGAGASTQGLYRVLPRYCGHS